MLARDLEHERSVFCAGTPAVQVQVQVYLLVGLMADHAKQYLKFVT